MNRAALSASLIASALLAAACGGGGNDAGTPAPVATVTSVGAGTPMYRQTLVFTVNGTHLDGGIALNAPNCANATRLTAAPHASTATTAYFGCTVTAVGAQTATVVRGADNATLGSVAYTVPAPQVTLTVSNGAAVAGDLVLTLAPSQAPVTVDNFLAYVHANFYDGTIFHRHSPNFVLQAGGYTSATATALPAHKPTNAPIALEVGRGLSNTRLTVAMARTDVPNSATSEFFINLADNLFLDTTGGGYAVFGGVTAGADVVAAMVAAPCSPAAFLSSPECVPLPNLVIVRARQTR